MLRREQEGDPLEELSQHERLAPECAEADSGVRVLQGLGDVGHAVRTERETAPFDLVSSLLEQIANSRDFTSATASAPLFAVTTR